MVRAVKIDKTLTAEEVADALRSQFPDYPVKTKRGGKKMFIQTGYTSGLRISKGRKLVISRGRSNFLWEIVFFVLDLDWLPYGKKQREIVRFLKERFGA